MLPCFTVHWLWRGFFLRPQRTADSHGVIMCIAKLQVEPAPEHLSPWAPEPVQQIDRICGWSFELSLCRGNAWDWLKRCNNCPFKLTGDGSGKASYVFLFIYSRLIKCQISPPSSFTLRILYNDVWCLDDLEGSSHWKWMSQRGSCVVWMQNFFFDWLIKLNVKFHFKRWHSSQVIWSRSGALLLLFNTAALQFCLTLLKLIIMKMQEALTESIF